MALAVSANIPPALAPSHSYSISFLLTLTLVHHSLPTMLTLAHDVFPHIFASIVLYTDVPGLLRLRQTSTDMRDSVDALLFDHIVLCRPAPSGEGVEAREAVPPFARLPLLPLRPDRKNIYIPIDNKYRAAQASFRRQLAHTTAVDYYGTRANLSDYRAALSNLQVIRRPKDLSCPLVAPTVVDFRDITSRGRLVVTNLPGVVVCSQPGCTRQVVHMNYDAGCLQLNQTISEVEFTQGVKEIELVYRIQEGTTPLQHPTEDRGNCGLIGIGHDPFLYEAMRNGAKVTFVGVEKMLPWSVNLPHGLDGEALVQSVYDYLVQQVSPLRLTPEQLRSRILFQFIEVWDAAATALERCPPMYDTPLCVDESLFLPGKVSGELYEEWAGRAEYERDPDQFWPDGHLDEEAVEDLDPARAAERWRDYCNYDSSDDYYEDDTDDMYPPYDDYGDDLDYAVYSLRFWEKMNEAMLEIQACIAETWMASEMEFQGGSGGQAK